MQAVQIHNGFFLVFERGEDLMPTLLRFCEENEVHWAQFQAIGTLEDVEIGYYDLPSRRYVFRSEEGPFEVASMDGNISEKEKEERSGKSKKNRRQLILISIFVILFIILGIMFIMSFGGEEKNLKNNETRPSVQIISPSPTTASTSPDLPVGSSSAILGADDISITIIRNSQSLQASALLREGLIKIGFNNIVSEDSEDAVPARSSVLFSKDISTNIRQIAIAEINKIFPSALVLESENSDSEITIIVGQS